MHIYAYLDEAVMEVEAEEAGGEGRVSHDGLVHHVPDHVLRERAPHGVVVYAQRRHGGGRPCHGDGHLHEDQEPHKVLDGAHGSSAR